MAKLEDKIENLIEDKIRNLGYELYDVEYAKEGKEYFLRVYIDTESGISLEDCENVSNSINELLDNSNYITEQYFLEVSSPGVERILRKDKHFEKNINEEVSVKLFKPINGKKELIGILKNYNENILIIQAENEITIDRKQIAQIKTIYNWE